MTSTADQDISALDLAPVELFSIIMPAYNEEDVIEDVLSIIPNWEKSNCTAEQIAIACSLADEQWLEVMESLGMVDLDIDAELEEAYLFNTDLDKL